MRIHIDLASHLAADAGIGTSKIIQVSPDPSYGEATTTNGQFLLPMVDGIPVTVNNSSYVLPIDGQDITSQIFAGLLARYPQYQSIYFNPLLRRVDLDDLDLTGTMTLNTALPGEVNAIPVSYATRAKVGRHSGVPATNGIVPNLSTLLPRNTRAPSPLDPTATFERPGLLLTKSIDLTATNPKGANDFMLYWKCYAVSTSQDISGHLSIGSTASQNIPALRSLVEVDQETAGFQVFLSIDEGQTWQSVQRLTQIAFCDYAPTIRLAFMSNLDTEIALTHFAVLF